MIFIKITVIYINGISVEHRQHSKDLICNFPDVRRNPIATRCFLATKIYADTNKLVAIRYKLWGRVIF